MAESSCNSIAAFFCTFCHCLSDAVAIHCQKRETDNFAQKMQRNYSTTPKMLKKPEELTHIEILRLWRKLINETATSVSALLEEEKNTVFLFFCSKRQRERERELLIMELCLVVIFWFADNGDAQGLKKSCWF